METCGIVYNKIIRKEEKAFFKLKSNSLSPQSVQFQTTLSLPLPHVAFLLLLPPPLKLQQSSNLWPSFLLQIAKGGHFWSREAHLYVWDFEISGLGRLLSHLIFSMMMGCGIAWMLWKLGRIDGDSTLRGTRIRATWEYVSSVGGGQHGMVEWYLEICRGGQETLGTSGGVLLPKTKLDQSQPNPGIVTHCGVVLPTPTPYRLLEPVQVIEVTSSEEDPEEDLEELPPEPVVDALDFLEGDEDPLPEVDSPEDVMSAFEADSTEDSGPREIAISGGSSS
ncbi:hypothetical protein HKD37_02G004790 [Glycine soja]